MAEFSQNKKYNHIWQNSKFRDVSYSGSYISQFTNDVGYITLADVPASSGSLATGSLLNTASFLDPNLTFTKGDGSTFNVDISSLTVTYASTASYVNTLHQDVLISGSLNVTSSFTASGLRYPSVDDGAFSFIQTDGAGNLSLQYVHTLYDTIYNGEVTTITKGTPLYVSGSNGANPKVFRADPTDPLKMPAIYIAGDNIATSSTGRGILLGEITGIDTTGYPAGTEIYLAPGGGWTSTRPTGSCIIQVLGYVTKEGSGGQGIVLNPGPANLPNLNPGSVWVGDSNSAPIATLTSSLSVASAISSSYASTASYVLNAISASYSSTASYVTIAQTASYVLQAVSASYATTASYVNGSITKNNVISNLSFGGSPLTASVTFTTAFPNTNYSVIVTGEDNRTWTVGSKTSSGFTINSNSSVALTGNTYWQASSYGEFNG